jgi:hypothetical protein
VHVTITIGRVELRPAPEPAPAPNSADGKPAATPAAATSLPLAEYLSRRGGAGR